MYICTDVTACRGEESGEAARARATPTVIREAMLSQLWCTALAFEPYQPRMNIRVIM